MLKDDKNYVDRELVGVLFPGIVKNEEKALQCLGGIKGISQVYSHPDKRRLGLNYQPDNPYMKRIFADAHNAAGVLLSVKVKKKKEGNEVKREVVSTSVLGRVKNMFRFESMCDFQYLPVHKEGSGPPQCLLEKIIPSGLDTFDFMSRPCPYPPFIVPSSFTRSDKPTNYSYTEKRYVTEKKEQSPDRDDDVHHKTRSDRGVPLSRFPFNLVDDLPSEPQEFYLKQKEARKETYPNIEQEFEIVKKMFDERPIWSQNQIKFHTKIRTTSLKMILPCLAIYLKNGPWRMLWVRFGYDPRKDPGARIYQSLDFRLRHTAGVHCMVMTRGQVSHYKKADRVKSLNQRTSEPGAWESVSEGTVCFRPGMVPAQRQIFYQYCDVKLPEVEEILAAEPPPGYLCHQNRGWLPPNTDHICRDHIFRYAKQALLASHNADLKFEQGSSDEGSNSDGEGTSATATEIDEPFNT